MPGIVARTVLASSARGARRVAFQSRASDLVCAGSKCAEQESDTNLLWDVFLHDRDDRSTMRVSGDTAGEWMENSRAPWIDPGGRVLVFGSHHPWGAGDAAHDEDLFVVPLGADPR